MKIGAHRAKIIRGV